MEKEAREKRAVVTLVLGEEARQMYAIAEPFFRHYAGRIGADFVPLQTAALEAQNFYMEKFQVAELLDRYDRILFLDADILVQPHTPDLFSLVPASHFGVVYDNPDNSATETSSRKSELRRSQAALGDVGWTQGYFNSGVMVFSKSHRMLFENADDCKRIKTRYPDQTLLNYNIHRYNVPVFHLDSRFNGMGILGFYSKRINPKRPFAYGNNKFEAYIMHFANEGNRVVQMAECASQLHERLDAIKAGGQPDPLDLYGLAKRNVENPDAKSFRGGLKSRLCNLVRRFSSGAVSIPVVCIGAVFSRLLYSRNRLRTPNSNFGDVELGEGGWSARSSLYRLGCFPKAYMHVAKEVSAIKAERIAIIGTCDPVLQNLLEAFARGDLGVQKCPSVEDLQKLLEDEVSPDPAVFVWNLKGEEYQILRHFSAESKKLGPSLVAVYEYIRPGSLATFQDALAASHEVSVLTDTIDDTLSSWEGHPAKWLSRSLYRVVSSDRIKAPCHWLWIVPNS